MTTDFYRVCFPSKTPLFTPSITTLINCLVSSEIYSVDKFIVKTEKLPALVCHLLYGNTDLSGFTDEWTEVYKKRD